MRGGYLGKTPSWGNSQRKYSPKPHNPTRSNISVHSEHLWNMMQDPELFPEQIHQLLKFEERNLSNYKRGLEREKIKISSEFEHMKKQIIHNIDDLKLSIHAELDSIYRNYMQKYANLKGEIMDIKRMKDELQIDIDRRNTHAIPKYEPTREKDNFSHSGSNVNIMKSLEKNNFDVKKYQMLGYIAELQKEKIIPMKDITNQLIILTQYENGYYQHKQFQQICNNLINDFKAHLHSIYERKYEFLRDPDQLCQKQEENVLEGIYEEQPQPFNPRYNVFQNTKAHPASSINPNETRKVQGQPLVSKLSETKIMAISPDQQNICFEWGENIALNHSNTIKSQSQEIILCALEVVNNIMAVGGKDGMINIYQVSSGQKIANLRGHKASICKLAVVQNNGKKYLASGSDHGCSSIVLWDVSTWSMRMRIESHKAAVTSIVDMQDNRSLISGSYDKNINVYNLNNEGKLLFNLPVNKTSVTAIILNCNGTKMVSCGLDNTLNVWQVARQSNLTINTIFLERIIQNNTMICSLLASVLNPDLVILGAKDGKVKLINISRGESYKSHMACNNAVIQMVAAERQSKIDYPLLVCWPCGEQCMKLINTQNGLVSNIPTRGSIQFGCGIGPKSFFVNGGRSMAMLSQSRDQKEVNVFKLDVIN